MSSSSMFSPNQPTAIYSGRRRTYAEECKFLTRIDKTRFKINIGFVPNMKVHGEFYVNDQLETIMFDELAQHCNSNGVGGFLPAVKQIANVASLPGIVTKSIGLPDVHSGYGFAIGNVAAFDMSDPDAIVSPGGVGFDINCLTLDQQILTDRGFLFLSQIQSALHATPTPPSPPSTLNIACYDVALNQLIYVPIDHSHLIIKDGRHQIYDFHCNPAPATSGPDGEVPRAEQDTHVRLSVDAGHELYVLLGSGNDRWTQLGSVDPRSRGPYEKMTARDVATSPFGYIKMLGCAASGHSPACNHLPPADILGLRTVAEVDAFLEFYGYWLGDGSLHLRDRAITLCPTTLTDVAYLDQLLARLPLVRSPSYLHGNGYWRQTEMVNNQLRYSINHPVWFQYFAAQYGIKYLNDDDAVDDVEDDDGDEDAMHQPTSDDIGPTSQRRQRDAALEQDQIARNKAAAVITPLDIKSAKWFWWWVLKRCDQRQLRLILKGLKFADGDQAKERDTMSVRTGGQATCFGSIGTSSVTFRDELQLACIQAGTSAYFVIEREVGSVVNHNKMGVPIKAVHRHWKVHYSDDESEANPVLHRDRDISQPRTLDGRVWCVNVPHKDHLIMVRRATTAQDGTIESASRPVIVGNCGVRLIRTNLHETDVRPVQEKLTQSLFDHIPVGVGSKGVIPTKMSDLVEALEMGMDWSLREGYAWAEDKEHCLTGNTRIAAQQGVAFNIEQFILFKHSSTLSHDAQSNQIVVQPVSAHLNQGLKPCIELLFNNGATLQCTPDHRLMCFQQQTSDDEQARWIEAQHIKLNSTLIAASVDLPLVDVANECAHSSWQLTLTALDLTLNVQQHLMLAMALCRVLGYCFTHDAITSHANSTHVIVASQFDADALAADLALLTSTQPAIININNAFSVQLHDTIKQAFVQIGIDCTSSTLSHLPSFLLHSSCPVALVREFLGALFGCSAQSIRYEDEQFKPITLKLSTNHSQTISSQLMLLFSRFHLQLDDSCFSMCDGSLTELPSSTLTLTLGSQHVPSFAQHVGFRYAARKQMLLSAANCYYRPHRLIDEQRSKLEELTVEYLHNHHITHPSTQQLDDAVQYAQNQLSQSMLLHPAVVECHSAPFTRLSISDSLNEFHTHSIFNATSSKSHTYSTFAVKVIAVREIGVQQVYDITVPGTHNFLAAGIAAHNCEEYGRMLNADPSKVSARAKKRGLPQLGTLGAGNHYAEIQLVEEIFDEASAAKMGIDRVGQVCIMVHSGSRGLGHQVATDALTEMERAMARDGIITNDKQLACARIQSKEGQDYLAAMSAAANYAWVNRSSMTFLVRQTFAKMFNTTPDDLDMHVIYDVSHNIAKVEEHMVNGERKKLLVHRKGSTRAFPPHHPLIPVDYQLTGQPVLIGGTMGSHSYVLTGTAKGMQETFGSTCHGAGRAMSRNKSRRALDYKDVLADLADKGISIRVASPKLVMEEAPESYKDVTQVVQTCHDAGISKKCIKLKPIAVVKG